MMKGFVALLAVVTALLIVPVASADQPVGPGGCNMLAASTTGLTYMMAGSQNGSGQNKMFEMLAKFDC
jgi:hypothetical protein